MALIELLSVSECFQLAQIGLILAPDFSVPPGRWSNFSDQVTVIRPDGSEFTAKCWFAITHFNFQDPNVPIDKRWRIVLSLPEVSKEDAPSGSKVMVSQETADAVLRGSAG